jgi:hypothetical protein
LSNAARNARSSFLKCEAFRLLSPIVAVKKVNERGESNENDSLTQSEIINASSLLSMRQIHTSYLECVLDAIQDSEMKKTKRIRDVLKTTERVVENLEKNEKPDLMLYPDTLISLKDALQILQANSDSQVIVQLCDTIHSKLDGLIKISKEIAFTKQSSNDMKSPKKKKKKAKSPKQR